MEGRVQSTGDNTGRNLANILGQSSAGANCAKQTTHFIASLMRYLSLAASLRLNLEIWRQSCPCSSDIIKHLHIPLLQQSLAGVRHRNPPCFPPVLFGILNAKSKPGTYKCSQTTDNTTRQPLSHSSISNRIRPLPGHYPQWSSGRYKQ
jgi:hypothetical protein